MLIEESVNELVNDPVGRYSKAYSIQCISTKSDIIAHTYIVVSLLMEGLKELPANIAREERLPEQNKTLQAKHTYTYILIGMRTHCKKLNFGNKS